MRSDPSLGFSVPARLLHWACALLILGLTGLGYWMVDLTYYDAWYTRSLDLHKGFGMIAMVLGFAFVVRKLMGSSPAHLPSLPAWQVSTSKAVHGVLFFVVVSMPISGYMISTSAGDGIDVFGLINVPAVATVSDATRDVAIAIHYWTAYIGLAIIGVHAAATVKHHFIDKDRTLMRMVSGK